MILIAIFGGLVLGGAAFAILEAAAAGSYPTAATGNCTSSDFRPGRYKMLKVTILESPAERRFVVEGKLTQPWVSELESAWESARDARRGRRCVVDLSDTTFIDQSGRRLLMAMCREGVRIIAKGPYVKHLIKHLRRNGAKQAPCLSQDDTEKAQ